MTPVRRPKRLAACRQSAAGAYPANAQKRSERELLQLILIGDLNPCESRDYKLAWSASHVKQDSGRVGPCQKPDRQGGPD